MNDKELGELIGKVNAIKENTDKIPNMAIAVALHEGRINEMQPKVERHETVAQRALALCALMGITAGIIATMIKNTLKWG